MHNASTTALIIAWGDLGEAVSVYLDQTRARRFLGKPIEADASLLASEVSRSRFTFAVSHRIDYRNCKLLSNICASYGSIFIPMFLQGSALQFGPAIWPTSPPCWDCCLLRLDAHKRKSSEYADIDLFYEDGKHDPPRGLLPHIAYTCAALVYDSITYNALSSGELIVMDFLDWRPKASQLVPASGCEICDPKQLTKSKRSALEVLVSKLREE